MSLKPDPVLPLTREDIIGHDTVPNDDLASVANSIQSTNTLAAYAERNRRSRSRRLEETFGSGSGRFKVPRYFKRLFRVQSLDFESTLWDMVNLVLHPKQVYKSLYYQKETKDKWARDDPSFVIVLSLLLTVSAVLWGLAYSPTVVGVLKLIVYMVFVDFLLVGAVIASIGWVVSSKFLVNTGISGISTSGSLYQDNTFTARLKGLWDSSPVEWAYCFDVHCNSYLIIWLLLYFVQFFLLPLLKLENFFSTLIGNTLYAAALIYYVVVTFYGYNTLPFLQNTEYLLAPIPVLGLLWLVFTLSGFNMANYMSKLYFE